MMKDFWNSRYEQAEFAYGKEPNVYFKNAIAKLNLSGKILLPAEGEGRNAIYAAKKGLQVLAFDTSKEGKNKALALAKNEQVKIKYEVGELDSLNLAKNSFDVIALIYAHFPVKVRPQLHQQLSELLKPNGYLILEGFSKNHLAYRTKNQNVGGPDKLELLFSKTDILNDFKTLEVIEIAETEIQLNEGIFHNGLGSVIRFIGKKRT